jgi:SagB-type dehydrogenase family enzyme
MKGTLLSLIALLMVAELVCCVPSPQAAPVAIETDTAIPLPAPILDGQMSLEAALTRRRSTREFEDAPLTMAELSQLLWAAQGITHERGFRTAPSAGALYPLELYVTTAEGIFHYLPQGHELSIVSHEDVRQALYEAALQQDPVRQAPAVFVVTAVYERTEKKYGTDRGPRYVHLEAGHAAQNLLLQATALGFGAVPIGAFHDQEVCEALGLPSDHSPLYLVPVGHPHGSDP